MDTGSIVKLVTLCIFIIIGIASRIWLSQGNGLEQVSEAVIKEETGVDVNFDLIPVKEKEPKK